MEDKQCKICKASFLPQAMIGEKCKQCNGLYPDAESLEDIADPNKERAHLLNEKAIKELIYEVLESAGICRIRCQTCRKLFFRKSPAAKFCVDCSPRITPVEDNNSVGDKKGVV